MFDVCSLGDALIDFKPVRSADGGECIQPNAGGTSANIVCACARMGLKCAILGKVGSDRFGTFLLDTLCQYGIDTAGMVVDQDVRTTLAFVTFDENKDRSFFFFRNPGADMMLREDEVDSSIIEGSRAFYFSSMALTDEPVRSACRKALETAKERGLLICFDINLRQPLWKDLDQAREVIGQYIPYADVLKLSEEELVFLCGHEAGEDIGAMVETLCRRYAPGLLVVSMGEKGCYYRSADCAGTLPGYPVKAVDTTGAGDAFVGMLLSVLCRRFGADLSRCAPADITDMLDLANAAGAVSVTRMGSITSLPRMEEVEALRAGRWEAADG